MPLEPGVELQLLTIRGEESIVVDGQPRPWQARWFPLEAEVQLDDGLTLGEANSLALFYSPPILEARAQARVAGAQVLQAGVLANPQLFFGPRFSTEGSGAIYPAWLNWQLPLWGERDARTDMADSQLTQRNLGVIDTELETLMEVRNSFLRLGRLQRQEAVLSAVSDASQRVLDWVEGLQIAGEVDAVAVYLARTERDDALASLESLRADAVRTRRNLFELLGLLPQASVTLVIDEAAGSLPELPDSDADKLLGVPSLRAAEAAYASAEAALRVEISKQYPGIRIGPEFENDRGDPTVGIGMTITLPLFDRNKGGIAAAEETRNQARERYRATLLRASHAEVVARDDLEESERLLQIHREGAMRDADEAARTLDIRLRVGRADVLEVLAAQRSMARVRARMLELEEQASVARLRAAVAGGLALERPSSSNDMEMEK